MKKLIFILATFAITTTVAVGQKKEIIMLTDEIAQLNARIDSLEKVCVGNKLLMEQMEQMLESYSGLTSSYTELQNSLASQNAAYKELNTIYQTLHASYQELNSSYQELKLSYNDLQTVYQSHQELYALLKDSNDKNLQAVVLLMEKVDSISTAPAAESVETKAEAAPWDYVGKICNGMIAIRSGASYGFADAAGKVIISPVYEDVTDFVDGYAVVRKNDKWGVIDKTGKQTIACSYDSIDKWNNGIYRVQKGNLYGLVKTNGTVVQAVKYLIISMPSKDENRTPIRLGDKWGFIDNDGAIVISIKYSSVNSFDSGRAFVEINDDFFYIDRNGNRVY